MRVDKLARSRVSSLGYNWFARASIDPRYYHRNRQLCANITATLEETPTTITNESDKIEFQSSSYRSFQNNFVDIKLDIRACSSFLNSTSMLQSLIAATMRTLPTYVTFPSTYHQCFLMTFCSSDTLTVISTENIFSVGMARRYFLFNADLWNEY